jgi:uncharacterized protein (DUF1499 family)
VTTKATLILIGGLLIMTTHSGCAGSKPDSIGIHHNRLAACPASPNCVSSDAEDEKHRIAPFQLKGDPGQDWPKVPAAVRSLPRCRLITQTGTYLHAECRSRIFRFVDDLELLLDPASGIVAVRSASRLGYSDLRVNRRRIEALRSRLLQDGVIAE